MCSVQCASAPVCQCTRLLWDGVLLWARGVDIPTYGSRNRDRAVSEHERCAGQDIYVGKRIKWYARTPTTASGRSRPRSTEQQVLSSTKDSTKHTGVTLAVVTLRGGVEIVSGEGSVRSRAQAAFYGVYHIYMYLPVGRRRALVWLGGPARCFGDGGKMDQERRRGGEGCSWRDVQLQSEYEYTG